MGLVLVVDDSDFQRSIIKSTITSGGHSVVEATNGEECLKVLEKVKPDLIVMDLLMPKFNGLQVLEAMMEKKMNIPSIVLTADIQTTTKEKCEALGARAILNKPFKRPEILALIQKILDEEKI